MLAGGFGSNHPGAVRVAKVKAYYFDEALGIPVCDVVAANGSPYFGVRIITMSGGTTDSFEQVPPPTWAMGSSVQDSADVLIATGDGKTPAAYVLGTAYTPNLGSQLTTDTTDTGDEAEYHDLSHIKDRVTKHAGVRVVFASSGTWLLDLTATERPARIQLDKDTFLRISQDDKAEEYVLLGTATLKHLRSIHGRLDALADALASTQTAIAAIHANLAAGTCTAGGVTGYPLTDTGTNPTASDYPFDFSKSAAVAHVTDGGSDDLIAGCFRVSDVTKTEQG